MSQSQEERAWPTPRAVPCRLERSLETSKSGPPTTLPSNGLCQSHHRISSSRKQHSRRDYFDIFLKTLFLEHLPDKNDIFIWDRRELAEMRNLSA